MTVNINNLSPLKLKELRKGEVITIRYASSQHDVDQNLTRIIYDQFPKQVATAFSSKWAVQFPSAISRISLKDLSQPKEASITIIGGSLQIIQQILAWILSCCDGRGLQQFQAYVDKPFFKYFIIKQNAAHLGISYLEKDMDNRLNAIAARQIHSEDVRAMYRLLPVGHPTLKEIAAHLGTLIWEKRLRAFGAYRTLREEIPQFDADVNEVLEAKAAIWREEQKARRMEMPREISKSKETRKAKESRAAAPQKEQRELRLEQVTEKESATRTRKPIDEVAKQYLWENRLRIPQTSNTHANVLQQAELRPNNATEHKTIRCAVSRKAQNGRPTYVSLPLAAAGINNDDFSGDTFLSCSTSGQKNIFHKKGTKPSSRKQMSGRVEGKTQRGSVGGSLATTSVTNPTTRTQSVASAATISTAVTTPSASTIVKSTNTASPELGTPFLASNGRDQFRHQKHDQDHCPSPSRSISTSPTGSPHTQAVVKFPS